MGKHSEYKGGTEKGSGGRHRDDGTPCELGGVHPWTVVNTVHFSDDEPGVWHEILKCTACKKFGARKLDAEPKHRK